MENVKEYFVLNKDGDLIKSSGYQSANQLAAKMLILHGESVVVIKIRKAENV